MTTRSLLLAIVHHRSHQWLPTPTSTRRPSRHGYGKVSEFSVLNDVLIEEAV